MRKRHTCRCLFWAVLYGLLYLVLASEEDLADFDFADRKEIEWNYDVERTGSQPHNTAEQNFMESTGPFDDSDEQNQIRPFDWRENILKSALSKALTNVSLRQKFVEVMPILRVLSSQQRLALSALISAQINAKGGHDLKLDQVRMMFGDDKKLLLPIVYDIANLVRTSARKYLDLDFSNESALKPQQQHKEHIVIDRRSDHLSSAELIEEYKDKNIGTLSVKDVEDNNELSIEDFFSETGEEILDPKRINEELQEATRKSQMSIINRTNINISNTIVEPAKRSRRAIEASEFVHKLVRSVPLSINENENRRSVAENAVKLNTSGFLSTKDLTSDSLTNTTEKLFSGDESNPTSGNHFQSIQSYQEVEDLAFASLNGTVVDLQDPPEMPVDISGELLPSPEELIAGPRYRISSNKMHSTRLKQPNTKRKRVQVSRMRSKVSAQNNILGSGKGVAPPKKCERFTSSMCIRTEDYPLNQIMGSIRRHKNAMTALWADYYDKSTQLDISEDFDDLSVRRREDDATGGGMCQSIVRYARPQKARSASGEWKYIVNTGQHTQTLRLEKCTTPLESCSYLAHSYRSHCAQVYNYHRLLSWDKTRGLHVDIFKVPTCCSCQVEGFRQQFPPLSGSKTKDYTPAVGLDVYSTINEEIDYNDDQEEDDISYRFNNGYKAKHKKHDTGYDNNELSIGSHSGRAKLHSPNPTLGSYLSPPGGEEDASSIFAGKATRRRPYKSLGNSNLYNEARVDLDFSPSELHPEKEVNISGGSMANPNKRVPQERQRIHSVPHTAIVHTTFTATTETGATISTTPVNIHMADGLTIPSTTTGPRGVVRNRASIATNAYQTSAPSSFDNDTSKKQTNFNISSIYRNRQFLKNSGKKQKPRFRPATATAAATTTSRATPSSIEHSNQWSVFQHQQPTPAQSSRTSPYHVNSIYQPEYNERNVSNGIGIDINDSRETVQTSSGSGTKRINYNYHPIIDFFENQKYSTAEATVETIGVARKKFDHHNAQIYPHTITKSHTLDQSKDQDRHQSKERRIGFGGTSRNEGNDRILSDKTSTDDNAWHPVLLQMKKLS